MGAYLSKVRLRALTQIVDREERQIKNLPFLISVFYKFTHIVLAFENFKGWDLKCLGAPKEKERFSLSFWFGASLGTSTRRLADVGHIPLAESCRGAPVYGKRQRPFVRICFSMPDKNNTNHGLTTYF